MHQQRHLFSRRLYQWEADICRAFAHPERLRVLDFVTDRERSIWEMTGALNISGSNLWQHLRSARLAFSPVLAASGRCIASAPRRISKVCPAPCERYSTSKFVICGKGLLGDIDREQS